MSEKDGAPASHVLQQESSRRITARALVFDPRPHRLLVAGAASRLGMSALPRLGSPLALQDIEVPGIPGPDWLALEPRCAGLCGSDLTQAQLKADLDNPISGLISFPHVMGHEIVATVRGEPGTWVAVDPWLGCTARGLECCEPCREGLLSLCVHAGEPVLPGMSGGGMHLGNVRGLPGGFASQMVAHRSQCHRLPVGLGPPSAVLADPVAVGLHAVERSGFGGDGLALVLGAGTIGLCVVAALRCISPGADVVVSASWPHLAERVRELGAYPVRTDSRSITDAVAERTSARRVKPWVGAQWLTGGGAEVVIDAIGSAETTEIALRAVRPRGRVVRVGVGRAHRLQSTLGYYKEVEQLGSNGYRQADFARALELLATGSIPTHRRWLTHSFPLAEWRRAFLTAARPGRTDSVKVTLLPTPAAEEMDEC